MLCIVQRTVSDRGQDFTDDQDWIAVEVVRRRASHDDCSAQVERGEDDREQRSSPFVDRKAKDDAQEGVDLQVTTSIVRLFGCTATAMRAHEPSW